MQTPSGTQKSPNGDAPRGLVESVVESVLESAAESVVESVVETAWIFDEKKGCPTLTFSEKKAVRH